MITCIEGAMITDRELQAKTSLDHGGKKGIAIATLTISGCQWNFTCLGCELGRIYSYRAPSKCHNLATADTTKFPLGAGLHGIKIIVGLPK